MEGSVINQICASMDSFFDTEKKIGDYIVRNPKKVVDMTVGELAKECGVSEASVSRFCKRIELKGFHHLKISLARELVDAKDDGEMSGHISVDDMEGSLRGILSNKMEELRQTVAMIDREELKKILEAAKRCGAVAISITNNARSSVAEISTYHITTATREKLFLDGYCFSRVSATMVIEIIYLLLVSMRKESYESIVRHEQAMAYTKE